MIYISGYKQTMVRFHLRSYELDLMLMKHYAPNRCLYINVAKLRNGWGMQRRHTCSVKIFKEHCRYFTMITNFQSPNLKREIMKK